jgi:Condensation domain
MLRAPTNFVQARDAHLARLAAEEAMRPFDLAQGPLWRGSLLPLGEEDHGVLLTQHHVVSDGWSLSVLVSAGRCIHTGWKRGRVPPER